MHHDQEIQYEPQVAYARLCYQAVYEFIHAKDTPEKPANIESELFRVSEKLKYLDKQIQRAGYAIGSFYHRDKKVLSPESAEIVSKAKFYLQQELSKAKNKNLQTVREFLQAESKNPNCHDTNFVNLATDGAYSMLEAAQKLPNISLTVFYERQIEQYRSVCEKMRQLFLLFTLDDAVNKIAATEMSLMLRKLVVTNPHPAVIKALLEKKADPFSKPLMGVYNRYQQTKSKIQIRIRHYYNQDKIHLFEGSVMRDQYEAIQADLANGLAAVQKFLS